MVCFIYSVDRVNTLPLKTVSGSVFLKIREKLVIEAWNIEEMY